MICTAVASNKEKARNTDTYSLAYILADIHSFYVKTRHYKECFNAFARKKQTFRCSWRSAKNKYADFTSFQSKYSDP